MRALNALLALGLSLLSTGTLAQRAHPNASPSETVVYSFCSKAACNDGDVPYGALIDVKGKLFGTTVDAGENQPGNVFAIDPTTGKETFSYVFGGIPDGYEPLAGLTEFRGTLYGTTVQGGRAAGALFSIDPKSGEERVVHSFARDTDGIYPQASLFAVGKTLYSTTERGGDNDSGTIYAFDPATGAVTTLYSFQKKDGAYPVAELTNVKGLLYGTAAGGGPKGDGIVFSFDPSTDIETAVHTFQNNGGDGRTPQAGLTDVGKLLWGTTTYGGTSDEGTVFAIKRSTGREVLVYSFKDDATDGGEPHGTLINVGGLLYGTTYGGGAYGGGTVFAFNPDKGTETVLYSFGATDFDGLHPATSLTEINGVLYGTTTGGGKYNRGTVFKIEDFPTKE